MSLPTPNITTAGSTSNYGMNPKEIQLMDAPLIALVNQCEGDLRKLLFAFFSFLHRRTDFYIVHDNDDHDITKTSTSPSQPSMGFKMGDAEKLLLASFRQFPLRKIPKKQQQPPPAVVETNKTTPTTLQTTTKVKESKLDVSDSHDNKVLDDKNRKENGVIETEKIDSITTNEVRYTDDGLQIPIGNGGSTNRYKWTQTLEECTVLIPIPKNIRAKDLQVDMKAASVRIVSKIPFVQIRQQHVPPKVHSHNDDGGGDDVNGGGDGVDDINDTKEIVPFVDGTLYASIVVDESSWSLEGGVLIVLLYKKIPTFWKTIYVGDEEIDTNLVDSRRYIHTYDESTQAQIRKIIHEQQQQNEGNPPKSSSSSRTPTTATATRKEIPTLPPGVEYYDKNILEEKIKEKNEQKRT